MKIIRHAAIAAASVVFALSTPSWAQEDPFTGGDLVEVSGVTIEDGHYLDYAAFLASTWRSNQEFAKSQGWITGYEVMANVNKRPGEPDLYLIVRSKSIPDAAENERRNQAFRNHMKQTEAQLQAASGNRATFRKVISSVLLAEMKFK